MARAGFCYSGWMAKRIRSASIYQRPDSPIRLIAMHGKAGIQRDLKWLLKPLRAKVWLLVVIFAIAEAVIVEAMGLSMGRWTYLPVTPLIPGTPISLIPVTQLALLFPATFGVLPD